MCISTLIREHSSRRVGSARPRSGAREQRSGLWQERSSGSNRRWRAWQEPPGACQNLAVGPPNRRRDGLSKPQVLAAAASSGRCVSRRAFVVVLDACGVGALPDAADYGDEGSNTLAHLARAAGGLELPTLGRLGLGSILPLEGVPAATVPVVHGRLNALGPGKDSMAGHHELMGIVAPRAAPTYADGFPPDVVRAV
jgi:hypothetical protein